MELTSIHPLPGYIVATATDPAENTTHLVVKVFKSSSDYVTDGETIIIRDYESRMENGIYLVDERRILAKLK